MGEELFRVQRRAAAKLDRDTDFLAQPFVGDGDDGGPLDRFVAER